jgi:hypothetical protein
MARLGWRSGECCCTSHKSKSPWNNIAQVIKKLDDSEDTRHSYVGEVQALWKQYNEHFKELCLNLAQLVLKLQALGPGSLKISFAHCVGIVEPAFPVQWQV